MQKSILACHNLLNDAESMDMGFKREWVFGYSRQTCPSGQYMGGANKRPFGTECQKGYQIPFIKGKEYQIQFKLKSCMTCIRRGQATINQWTFQGQRED